MDDPTPGVKTTPGTKRTLQGSRSQAGAHFFLAARALHDLLDNSKIGRLIERFAGESIDPPRHRDRGTAQDVRHVAFPEPRGVVLERETIAGLVHSKTA